LNERGFSFIELLVALTITTLLIAGTAEMISLSLFLKRKADIHTEFVRSLSEKLEGLRTTPFTHPDLDAGEHRESFRPAGSTGVVIREWQVTDLPGGIKRVEIKISARGAGGPEARAQLLISGKLGFAP
jgi:prepilin-type N-terminal cleavage/methylation domain-containing protein